VSGLSNKRLRDIERVVHIVTGLLLMAYVYSPLADQVWYSLVIRIVVFPILVGSGLAMWQLPRARRWWSNRQTA